MCPDCDGSQHDVSLTSVQTVTSLTQLSSLLKTAQKTLPTLDEVMATHIRNALQLCNGKINGPGGAGEILGVHPSTLRKRMDKLGISYGRGSSGVQTA